MADRKVREGHIPSYYHLLADLELFIRYIHETYPEKRIFLYGHSMGGNVAANYLIRENTDHIQGAVITSPWLKLYQEPPAWRIFIGKIVRRIYPPFTQKNNLNHQDLSRDLSVGEAYAYDPLVLNIISTEMYFSISEAGQYALDHAADINTPLLVMHGEQDHITSPFASEQFAKDTRAQFRLWPGMRHEIHNEIGKEDVIQTMVQWYLSNLQCVDY